MKSCHKPTVSHLLFTLSSHYVVDYELESSDYTTEYYQEAEYGTSSPVVKVDNASQSHKSLEEDVLISPHDMDDYARFDHQNTRKPVTKKFKIAKDRIEILKKKNSRVCIEFVVTHCTVSFHNDP